MSAQPVKVFKLNRSVEKLFAHGFFFFFVFEIFSPYISGRTFYIQYFFIAANPFFWYWVSRIKIDKSKLYAVAPIVAIMFISPIAVLKLAIVFTGVAFLIYAYERDCFKVITFYIFVSIGVAIVQFSALMLGFHSLSYSLGPTALAHLVWGVYATETYTNFYTVFYFPRVSGLSREAGFFASLLVSVFLAYTVNRKIERHRLKRVRSFLIFVAYIISFSKSSISVLLAFLLVRSRKILDRVPVLFLAAGFLLVLGLIWNHYGYLLMAPGAITFLSRFGGYALLSHMSFSQLLLGVDRIQDIPGHLAQFTAYQSAYGVGLGGLAGIGGWCVHYGVISFFLYTIALRIIGIKGAGFALILLMTATVGIDTNQNFVLLSYYVAFMLPRIPDDSASQPR